MVLDLKKHVFSNEKNHEGGQSHTVSGGEEEGGDNRSGGSRHNWQRRDNPVLQIDALVFFDTDPNDWLARIERFFDLGGTAELDRLAVVAVCVEGQALRWFRYRERTGPFVHWRDFRREVIRRFGTKQRRTPEEEMRTLKQMTTVLAYRNHFEDLVMEVDHPTSPWLKGMFLAGLNGAIRAEVDMH